MQEIVVIDGEISLENHMDGEWDLNIPADGDPEVIIVEGGGQTYPHYQGEYTVTPSTTAQVLDTDGKVMDDDVTIEAVPQGSATTPQTIITADPTISVSSGGLITAQVSKTQQITPTVQEGYVEAGTPGNVGVSGSNTEQLTTQGAQTIHPASTDQSIASGKFLTGAQTFKAVTVTGLTADKVLQGTTVEIGDSDDSDRIMKVVGTAQGGITPTGTKQINIASNGTVTEDVTNYASAEITTNVPASAVDSGTKSISTNGTHDVVGYANASVNVPNSYSASDEGKVVSNGSLVSQTSDTVTANDTYDTTLINSLTVNVSGGALDWNAYASNTIPTGDVVIDTATVIQTDAFRRKPITSAYSATVTRILGSAFAYCPSLVNAIFPACTNTQNTSTGNQFQGSDVQNIVLPAFSSGIPSNFAQGASSLKVADMGSATSITTKAFSACTQFNTLILRRTDALCSLGNTNGVAENTPFKNGGAGGTIYIPKALYDHLGDGTALDYQSATNWSTVYGYGTITWAKIEGSVYESTTWWQNL